MKKIFKVIGIIAIAAVIGFALTGCPTPDDNGTTGGDSNGTTPTITHTHVWGAWTVTTPATCVAKGVETHTCTLDATHKETRETAIDPEAHDWELLEGTAPTCTTDGNGKEKCKLCEIEENGVLPKLGHDWGEWIQTKAPTETEDGQEERTCAHDATHKETNAIAALNHTHDWGDWSVTTPATCTADGEKVRVCKLNATHKDIEDIDALDHDWNDWEQTTAPTCTAAGVETQTCKRDASHKETRTGAAALGHSYAWVTTTPATCSAAGVETGTCTRDGNTTTRGIAALDHNYQWQATTPATLTSEGIETEICTHDSTHTRGTRTSDPLPITTAEQWNTATAEISGGGNDKTYDINVTGNFFIPGYSSETFGNVTGITVNIRGAGTITLTAGSTGSLLNISTNQTVSLKDTHLKGHSTNNTSLVYVGGTFNMTGGTISGNTNTKSSSSSYGGGGVLVVSGGTFNMSGTAEIRDNIANGVNGGGVCLNSFWNQDATFNMMGGTITGNTAIRIGGALFLFEGGRGGGIGTGDYDISSGASSLKKTFINITGGTISDNYAAVGGGVAFHEGTLTMSGGTISGNHATGTVDNNYGGGGVYLYTCFSETTFNMTGGNISDNIASNNGGGVLFYDGGKNNITFDMTGGTITGNSADNRGGGVFCNGASKTFFYLGSLDFILNNTASATVNPGNQASLALIGNFLINGSTPPDSITVNVASKVYRW